MDKLSYLVIRLIDSGNIEVLEWILYASADMQKESLMMYEKKWIKIKNGVFRVTALGKKEIKKYDNRNKDNESGNDIQGQFSYEVPIYPYVSHNR